MGLLQMVLARALSCQPPPRPPTRMMCTCMHARTRIRTHAHALQVHTEEEARKSLQLRLDACHHDLEAAKQVRLRERASEGESERDR